MQQAGATGETFGPVPGYRIVRIERTAAGLPQQVLAVREGPQGFQQTCVLEAARVVATGGDPELVRGLITEARIAARVRHPSMPVVHDLIEHSGWLMLVMPFEGNLTLAHLTAALGRHTRRLDESIVWHIAHTLFDALDELHHSRNEDGNPVVHGDLRPGNLVIRSDGGLVLRGCGGTRGSYWPAGEAGRRGLYDCPMRLEGTPASIATDLYAAAAIVWELLVDAPVAARYHAPGALLESSDERSLPPLAVIRPELPHAAAAAIDLCLSMDPDRPMCTAAGAANIIHRSTDALAGREKLARLHGNVFARMGTEPRSRWATAPSRPGGVDCDAPTERVRALDLEFDLAEDDCDTVRVARGPSGVDTSIVEPWVAEQEDETTTEMLDGPAPQPIMSFPPVANSVGSEERRASTEAEIRKRAPLTLMAIAAAIVAVVATVAVARGRQPGSASCSGAGLRLSRLVPVAAAPVQSSAEPVASSAETSKPVRAVAGWRSSLVVHGPPEGVVFVQGVPLGRTGEVLDTPCGMRNVRIGTEPKSGVMGTVTWLAPGQAVKLPCGGAVEVLRP